MRRLALLFAVAALLGSVLATAEAGASGVRAHAMKQRLTSFNSCERLIKYARSHIKKELQGGFAGPTSDPPFEGPRGAPPAAADGTGTANPEAAPTPTADAGGDSSGTNVQEAGVDEPDMVKTDGKRIFAFAGTGLRAIDARATPPRLLGRVELGTYGGQLILDGKRLLVISYADRAVDLPGPGPGPEPQPSPAPPSSGDAQVAPGEPSPPDYYYRPATLITEVDVSDPAAMKVVRTETIDGDYVSARLNGSTARIVLSTPPAALDYGSAALRRRARGWVPSATLENKITGTKRTRRLAACRQVRRPRVFSGLNTLSVLTIDMRKGLPAVDVDGLMTDAETVYASNDGLYVATQRYLAQESANEPPPPLTTAIHRFDISEAGRTAYRASGDVTGYVTGQFSLSEHEGVLRVASTDSPVWWPGGSVADQQPQSYVSTLKPSGDVLLPLGRVGGLGRGERIQGVRFLGDAGYVVTFRQTDPLYTIDLSKPAEPRVAGELKLLGYSAYLHPVDDGLLLGVGQDATAQGRQLGTQLSLFDVSDLEKPTRLSQRRIGSSSSSEAEYDHHAFLYWAPEKLAVLPVNIYDGSEPFYGAIGFRVGRAKIDEIGRIQHDVGQIRRSVVVNQRLFTISDVGAEASLPGSLAEDVFLPF